MADQKNIGTYTQLFNEGIGRFNLTALQATFFAELTLAVTHSNPQVSSHLVNSAMNSMYSNPRLTAQQIQQILQAVEQKTQIKIQDPLAPRSSLEEEEISEVAAFDQVDAVESQGPAGLSLGVPGGKAELSVIATMVATMMAIVNNPSLAFNGGAPTSGPTQTNARGETISNYSGRQAFTAPYGVITLNPNNVDDGTGPGATASTGTSGPGGVAGPGTDGQAP